MGEIILGTARAAMGLKGITFMQILHPVAQSGTEEKFCIFIYRHKTTYSTGAQ